MAVSVRCGGYRPAWLPEPLRSDPTAHQAGAPLLYPTVSWVGAWASTKIQSVPTLTRCRQRWLGLGFALYEYAPYQMLDLMFVLWNTAIAASWLACLV